MIQDWFEQLAEQDVPPAPVDFDRRLHERVNDSLLAVHYLEFACRAAPYALLHFSQAMIGALRFTLTGKYPSDRPDRPHPRR